MTSLEKRLIALSAHGIWIEYADGHRWVRCADNENGEGETYSGFHFDAGLKRVRALFNNKIYGGLIEALDLIDMALINMRGYTLESWYDEFIEEKFDIFSNSSDNGLSRIGWDVNEGGLV